LKPRTKLFLKGAVSVGLLFGVFRSIAWRQVWLVAAGADPTLVAAAVLAQAGSTTLASYRWGMVMDTLGARRPWQLYLASYFKGAFLGQFLPGSVGGDVVRAIDLSRAGSGKRGAILGVLLDRVVALPGLALINLASVFVSPGLFPVALRRLSVGLDASVLAGLVVAASFDRLPFIGQLRLLHPLTHISRGLRSVYRGPGRIGAQLGLAVCIHLLAISSTIGLARSMGMGLPAVAFCALVPLAVLATVVPVSLAGWGVREGAMVGLFHLVGAPKEPILAVSLMYGAVVMVTSLPGLWVWLRQRQGVV